MIDKITIGSKYNKHIYTDVSSACAKRHFESWVSHSRVAEDSGLMQCKAGSLGE
jgi:hypothetical protein